MTSVPSYNCLQSLVSGKNEDLGPTRGVAIFDGKNYFFDGIGGHKERLRGGYEFLLNWEPTWERREKYEKEEAKKKTDSGQNRSYLSFKIAEKRADLKKKKFTIGMNGEDAIDARYRPDGGIDLLVEWEPSFVNEEDIKLVSGQMPTVEADYRLINCLSLQRILAGKTTVTINRKLTSAASQKSEYRGSQAHTSFRH